MRMSEFEQSENEEGKDVPPFLIDGPALPDDFTDEDRAFAAELHALFSPAEEKLPPYYVQTLLDVDDRRFEPVVRGFEYKTNARVFRRLKMRRRLFRTRPSLLTLLSRSLKDTSLRRSALTMVGSFMLIMLLTIAFTGSSFASGVAILLGGTHHAGVYEVKKFPVGQVHISSNAPLSRPATRQITVLAMEQQLHFSAYWPAYMPEGYMLLAINCYVGLDQQWADGPILEFEYGLPPSIPSMGRGEIWIREFLPRTDVLQLVEADAASYVNVGDSQGIFVDGQWTPDTQGGSIWQSGMRSELIYQMNGVIFWIAGDQRNGIGAKDLVDVAAGLQLYSMNLLAHSQDDPTPINQRDTDAIDNPFSTDVIIIFPSDGSDTYGSYYISVTTSQPPKNAH